MDIIFLRDFMYCFGTQREANKMDIKLVKQLLDIEYEIIEITTKLTTITKKLQTILKEDIK